jgi:hypothetical protein
MQPDNPYMSCCGEADVFEADSFVVDGDHYVAIITNGKGIIPSGTRIAVPNQKMKWDRGNPTGHGIIFIGAQGSGPLLCNARRSLISAPIRNPTAQKSVLSAVGIFASFRGS